MLRNLSQSVTTVKTIVGVIAIRTKSTSALMIIMNMKRRKSITKRNDLCLKIRHD